MNRSKRGVPCFARTRRALFAGLLGLGLVILWPGAALTKTYLIGPYGTVDSVTDDGGGRIRVSWSLPSEPPEGHVYRNSYPDKVCVEWRVVENGVTGSTTDTCFTSEASSQADLLVDTGIGGDGPATVYSVMLVSYYQTAYGSAPIYPRRDDGSWWRNEVTLNASS